MAIAKCEKWLYDHHRTILWLLFIISMYYVCILKLKNQNEAAQPQAFLALIGRKNVRKQFVESVSPQRGPTNGLNEALRWISPFRNRGDVGREKLMEEPSTSHGPLVQSSVHVGHGSTSTFSDRMRIRHVVFPNAFDQLVRFLTPSPIQCRNPAHSVVKKNLPSVLSDDDRTMSRDSHHECLLQAKCEKFINDTEKKRCQDLHKSAYRSHSSPRKILAGLSNNHVLSRIMTNFFPDKMGSLIRPTVKHVDLYVDESLSFLTKIRELRKALERDMELTLHMNFSGLNTIRKHGIIGQFLQSAHQALHQRVLVRSSLHAAELGRLLQTESVGSPAVVTFKTKWRQLGPNIENDRSMIDYFSNSHK